MTPSGYDEETAEQGLLSQPLVQSLSSATPESYCHNKTKPTHQVRNPYKEVFFPPENIFPGYLPDFEFCSKIKNDYIKIPGNQDHARSQGSHIRNPASSDVSLN